MFLIGISSPGLLFTWPKEMRFNHKEATLLFYSWLRAERNLKIGEDRDCWPIIFSG